MTIPARQEHAACTDCLLFGGQQPLFCNIERKGLKRGQNQAGLALRLAPAGRGLDVYHCCHHDKLPGILGTPFFNGRSA